jgi:uncharacterized damage-inducible protein DinB
MSFFETQVQAWDSAHWEFSLVFEDLHDEDLWRRAHPRLLSVGEIVAHMVYWQVEQATVLNPSFSIETPLKSEKARYYLTNVEQPFTLPMSVEEVANELDRVQKAVREALLQVNAKREDSSDHPGPTLGHLADYMVFHVAYHTGQAFSVRHLMGHKTNDN